MKKTDTTSRIIASSAELLKQARAVYAVINDRHPLSVTHNILLEVEPGSITMTATDLETTLSVRADAETKDTGAILLPAKLLVDALATIPDQPITITADTASLGIAITTHAGRYNICGADAADFPKAPTIENPGTFSISGQDLATALAKTLPATGKDTLRIAMTGVRLVLTQKSVEFAATNAHSMSIYTFTGIAIVDDAAITLPGKPMSAFLRLLPEDSEVTVSYTETNACFSFGRTTMIVRLIDYRYPSYRAVVPKDGPNALTVDRLAFLEAVRRISVFSNKTTQSIALDLSPDGCSIAAEDLDYATDAKEDLPGTYDGAPMRIGFNANLLRDALSLLDGDDAVIRMNQPSHPAVVEEEPEVGASALVLCMPLMLQ